MSFKVGDTVRLKSGGPVMTVIYLYTRAEQDYNIVCGWFDNTGNMRDYSFNDEIIVPAEPFDQEKATKELVKDLSSVLAAGALPMVDPREQP